MSDGAVEQNVLELPEADGGARRPSAADVGIGLVSVDFGAGAVDVAVDERKPVTRDGFHIYRALINQFAWLCRASGLMMPVAKLDVSFSGGTPQIDAIDCANTTLSISDFELQDHGTGLTSVKWLTWKLPPLSTSPIASARAASASIAVPRRDATPPTDYTRIYINTYTSNVLADVSFTIWI